MGHLDAYTIPFPGLKPGKHEFGFTIDGQFFEQYESTEAIGGKVEVQVELDRSERMLDFTFFINGQVILPCDRCGDPAEIPVRGTERLLVKVGEEYLEESDSVIVIPDSVRRFDLAPHLYDYIRLLIPFRRLHADLPDGTPGCNPEVLKKLDELSDGHTADPRWEILKEIQRKSKI